MKIKYGHQIHTTRYTLALKRCSVISIILVSLCGGHANSLQMVTVDKSGVMLALDYHYTDYTQAASVFVKLLCLVKLIKYMRHLVHNIIAISKSI